MNFLGFILAQCLSALSQAAILFFIACGLTLIFGIMRIVNFAHGVIFMLGAYVGYTANVLTGSFLVSLVVAPIVVGLVGMVFEWTLLRHLYGRRDDHLAVPRAHPRRPLDPRGLAELRDGACARHRCRPRAHRSVRFRLRARRARR